VWDILLVLLRLAMRVGIGMSAGVAGTSTQREGARYVARAWRSQKSAVQDGSAELPCGLHVLGFREIARLRKEGALGQEQGDKSRPAMSRTMIMVVTS
jgi:hypothetical protein